MDTSLPVPWWVEVLQLANEWSMAPWLIVNDKGPALWILRKRIMTEVIEQARRDRDKHKGKRK